MRMLRSEVQQLSGDALLHWIDRAQVEAKETAREAFECGLAYPERREEMAGISSLQLMLESGMARLKMRAPELEEDQVAREAASLVDDVVRLQDEGPIADRSN